MAKSQRDHVFRRLVKWLVSRQTYIRLIKILIRNSLIHEKSYKFRRDVVGAVRAFEFEEIELNNVPRHQTHQELVSATLRRCKPELTTCIELGL
jgi:hypothetical protein